MGKAGECIAIGTYVGVDAINGFYYIIDNPKISPTQYIRYQNNLMCYFGDRNELSSKELKVIKDLGLKFRGKNEWIYFRAFETGYVPYILDELQVVQLTFVFQQLYMALEHFDGGKIKVDFEGGNILKRKYDDKSKLWLTSEAPNIIPSRVRMTTIINDELLLAKLNKLKDTRNEIELDTLFLNVVINDKEFERPFLGKLLIIAECKSGMFIDQSMLSPKDDVVQNVLGIFIKFLMQNGKLKTVYVRGKTSIFKSIYYNENKDEKRINTDEMVARIGSWKDNNLQMKSARKSVLSYTLISSHISMTSFKFLNEA